MILVWIVGNQELGLQNGVTGNWPAADRSSLTARVYQSSRPHSRQCFIVLEVDSTEPGGLQLRDIDLNDLPDLGKINDGGYSCRDSPESRPVI